MTATQPDLRRNLYAESVSIVQTSVAGLLNVDERQARGLAIAALTAQVIALLAATISNVMLYADGAWFVFALSAGDAWILKWKDIAARFATYALTVTPTAWITQAFDLAPATSARVNGFIFYAVPAIQMAICFALVWRKHPTYLLFPVAQYALFSALSFGFPSEILLAPGFLWIALFLVLIGRGVGASFLLCFLGVVFSHELAIPAALVAGYLAVRQAQGIDRDRSQKWRAPLLALAMALILVLFFVVRASGGGAGSDAMAIYVFDPRRVLNNPGLWLLIAMLGATALVLLRRPAVLTWKYRAWLLAVPLAAPLIIQAVWPDFNFAQGRYDSARTFIGGGMFLLALCFALTMHQSRGKAEAAPVLRLAPYFLAVALMAQIGSGAAFLRDWGAARSGVQRASAVRAQNRSDRFMAYSDARALMRPEEAKANDRLGILWSLPFRSIVLAEGALPERVIYDGASDYTTLCGQLGVVDQDRSRISPEAIQSLRAFGCTHPAPEPVNTLTRRFKAFLAEHFGKR